MQRPTGSTRPWGLLALIAATTALAIGYASLARRQGSDALEKAERDLDFTDTSLGEDGEKNDDEDSDGVAAVPSKTRHPTAAKTSPPVNSKQAATEAADDQAASDTTATIETIDEEDMMGETIEPPLD